MRFDRARTWMIGVALAVAVFGIALAVTPLGADRAFRWMLFGRSYPASFSPEAAEHLRFVHAVLGATMAGWAMLMALILAGPFRRRERWSWQALAISLGVWFVADTTASLAAGYWQNALLNTVIVAAFAPALALTHVGME